MLSNERLYQRKCFTAARISDNPRAPKAVIYIDKSTTGFTFYNKTA